MYIKHYKAAQLCVYNQKDKTDIKLKNRRHSFARSAKSKATNVKTETWQDNRFVNRLVAERQLSRIWNDSRAKSELHNSKNNAYIKQDEMVLREGGEGALPFMYKYGKKKAIWTINYSRMENSNTMVEKWCGTARFSTCGPQRVPWRTLTMAAGPPRGALAGACHCSLSCSDGSRCSKNLPRVQLYQA